MGATSTAVSKRDLRGKRIGRYLLIEHLASGGMAEIFLARHESDGGFVKELALKVLQARFANEPAVVEMFLTEARLAAKLNHPNVVDVYDLGIEDGLPFIAMEHIPGKTLAEVIRRGIETSRPLRRELAVHLIAQAAAGLAHLQDQPGPGGVPLGIVHRDISPSNLIVAFGGQTKIIDFGIAQEPTGGADPEGARPGKVSYMSPEQVQGRALDGRSDVFALGTILYEITLGRRLWRGPRETVLRRIVEERPAPPTYVDRQYPPALELVVMRALEKRAEDRYASAQHMCEELNAFLDRSEGPVRAHHLATYLRELYAPEAQVSAEGLREARAFPDDHGADQDEELRLDDAPGAVWAKAFRGREGRSLTPSPVLAVPLPPKVVVAEPPPALAPTQPSRLDASTPEGEAMAEGDGPTLIDTAVRPDLFPAPAPAPGPLTRSRGVLVSVALACAAVAGIVTWWMVGS